MTITAYPLAWPAGWKRTDNALRVHGRFNRKEWRTSSYTPPGGVASRYQAKADMTVAVAVDRVRSELGRMGLRNDDVVISTNLKLRLDGLARSDQREPDDSGAAVYWVDRNGSTRCMAIDRYHRVADNLAAIAATLDAMRAIERHGGAEILDRAFTGFTALPPPSDENGWWKLLAVDRTASAAEIEAAYRRERSKHHPDRGGDPNVFNLVQNAYAAAIAHITQRP